jgi:hypothetical protein
VAEEIRPASEVSGKSFRQERIANGTRKWNVDDSSVMDMADFGICEAELTSSKSMREDRDPGPRRDSVFELLERLHNPYSLDCSMPEQACSIHGAECLRLIGNA